MLLIQTGIIKDRQEIRFKIVAVENFCQDTSILNVQYTFDRTKEEDFDLSKHNGSEPLVAMTVIWRKDETFKRGRQYRQWRLDVSNPWKIFFSTRESKFFDFFRTKNIFDNARKNFCVFFRVIVNFQNLFLSTYGKHVRSNIYTIDTIFFFFENKSMELN